ncbi:MAG: hypothetical protein ACTSU3_01370 [Candidatus Thorarchaeota archaeon]
MTELTTYRSMTQYNVVFALGTILSFLIGFFLVPLFMPFPLWDWTSILGIFVGLPILLSSLSYYYGWNFKVNVVEYNAPEWDFEPVQLPIDDARRLPKQFNKENSRLIADGNYWMFFIPIILLVFISAFPVYALFENPGIAQYASITMGTSFAILFAVTLFTGFKSSSNTASADFTLPLIRETIRLAKIQNTVPGVANIRVVLDKAVSGDYTVYREPRVLLRIKGIESESYVESRTDDLGAITKVLCRLYEKDDNPQVVWWWIAEDRNFRKFVDSGRDGYYVKNPVQSNITFPGVKDASLVTENSIALIVKEYLITRDGSEELRTIIKELNVENT